MFFFPLCFAFGKEKMAARPTCFSRGRTRLLREPLKKPLESSGRRGHDGDARARRRDERTRAPVRRSPFRAKPLPLVAVAASGRASSNRFSTFPVIFRFSNSRRDGRAASPPPPRFQAGRSGRRRRAALRQPRPSFLPRPNCHISNPAASIIPAILSYLPRFYFCVMVASPVAASAWSPPPESFGLYPFSPLPFVARAPHDGRRSPLRSPAAASLFARDLPSV